ncbi:MAG: hypothetical protein OFPII_27910 [Osedax symbiont Rs1]|nr:MAG: hypothetical protein OFPII_27910 [Osedax symbiont Rs1]
MVQKGIFDKHDRYLPQLNILHPHGSVYWTRNDDEITLNYHQSSYDITFNATQEKMISTLKTVLENDDSKYIDLKELNCTGNGGLLDSEDFWSKYNAIPIVNPTKWKFHETVFEEAYYQILRHLSFELERPNSVLITFGFSFADEHILRLVERSLSNPSLTVYISCFNEIEKTAMQAKFKGRNNVKYICLDVNLTFEQFNTAVFTLNKGTE